MSSVQATGAACSCAQDLISRRGVSDSRVVNLQYIIMQATPATLTVIFVNYKETHDERM